jgi:GTPase SAR1 family protein
MAELLVARFGEEYTALLEQFVRDSHGFLIVYSITDRQSFEKAREFREKVLKVKRDLGETGDIPFVLVGNKLDLEKTERVVRKDGKDHSFSFLLLR